ncbi:uncharacterized protein LOC107038064 isoform X2 [Diachasma alloeum]|uniref:uncharacterized protein LOC107038064 isoform X2 n=1 Tax=Diachasma alloeum TaxID=454923 RepID=UPI0007383A8D|nr:uncharacterized protein LOC107038064 isoform X2 [Diachasma alloeum]
MVSSKAREMASRNKKMLTTSTPLGSTQANPDSDASVSSIESIHSATRSGEKRRIPWLERYAPFSKKRIAENRKVLRADSSDEAPKRKGIDPGMSKLLIKWTRMTRKGTKSVGGKEKLKMKGSQRKDPPAKEPEAIREAREPVADIQYLDKDRLFFRPPDHGKDDTLSMDEDDMHEVLHGEVSNEDKENDPRADARQPQLWSPRRKLTSYFSSESAEHRSPPEPTIEKTSDPTSVGTPRDQNEDGHSHASESVRKTIEGVAKSPPCTPSQQDSGEQEPSTSVEKVPPDAAPEEELQESSASFIRSKGSGRGRRPEGKGSSEGEGVPTPALEEVEEGNEEDEFDRLSWGESTGGQGVADEGGGAAAEESTEEETINEEPLLLEHLRSRLQEGKREIFAQHPEHPGILERSLINRWPVRRRTAAEKERIKRIVGCAPIVRHIGWLTYYRFTAYSSPSEDDRTDEESVHESSPRRGRDTENSRPGGRARPKKRKNDSGNSSIVRSKKRRAPRILESSDYSQGEESGSPILNRKAGRQRGKSSRSDESSLSEGRKRKRVMEKTSETSLQMKKFSSRAVDTSLLEGRKRRRVDEISSESSEDSDGEESRSSVPNQMTRRKMRKPSPRPDESSLLEGRKRKREIEKTSETSLQMKKFSSRPVDTSLPEGRKRGRVALSRKKEKSS